jgi:hypothetical protein
MTRNDQKFLADAIKNSADENLPELPLRQENMPPPRNAFIRILISIRKSTPEEKYETRPFSVESKSPTTSPFIPSISFSVIILFPNPAFKTPFIGTAKRETSKREKNQTIKTPFHTFNDRKMPDLKASNIFITY